MHTLLCAAVNKVLIEESCDANSDAQSWQACTGLYPGRQATVDRLVADEAGAVKLPCPLTIQTANFSTRYSLSVADIGAPTSTALQ